MNKCSKCGTEFEGNCCPECGTWASGEKSCPRCGAKIKAEAKFCTECGYSFTETQEKAKRKIDIKAWIKSHLKLVIALTVAAALIIILSCSIPACIAAQTNGTYYELKYDGELNKESYFILSSGKWEDHDKTKGTYKKDGDKIVFYAKVFGESTELCSGTVKSGVLKINIAGAETTYVMENHKHKFSKWETTKKATCNEKGLKTRYCRCGEKEEAEIPFDLNAHVASENSYVFYDKDWHNCKCSGCGADFREKHSGDNCACGYPCIFTLNYDGESYILKYLYTTETKYTIPSAYKGLPVTKIGSNNNAVFRDCKNLTSITIPDSVTSIGKYAFSECDSLTSITIGNGVTSIGYDAFSGCSSLTSVTVDKNNTTYKSENNCILSKDGKTLILGCKSSIIPNSVTSIGNSAFSGCSSLESVTIPDGVTYIGEDAFSGCSSLTSITIPNSITSIRHSAFEGCSSLTSITIPNSVTSIGNSAFEGCSSLTSVTIPDGVTSIGYWVFNGCDSLTSITIGNGITSIGEQAFFGCSSLTSITIPNSVTTFGSSAFGGCSSLTSITIPNSVTSIGKSAFGGCSSLKSVTIPDGVTSINSYAFEGCSSLTSITIGNGVTSIGYRVFDECDSLTSITIGNGVTSIDKAFNGCSSLTSITYKGTKAQWNAISKINDWNFNTGNYTVHCTDGDIKK